MARPLRIEFPGALYHLTSRGNARKPIYLDNRDRAQWIFVFRDVCERFNWVCYSYCMMTNHYHLMVETPEGNLSAGMRHLNGVYTQRFNRTHNRVGHLYQGRYSSKLVEKESYLLELSRYIVLNPVRAGMVEEAQKWPWSSYGATVGCVPCPNWLHVNWILSRFGGKKRAAIHAYETFVSAGLSQPSPLRELKNQIYLGSDEFIEEVQSWLCDYDENSLEEIPSAQKRSVALPLKAYRHLYTDRDMAMANAYNSGAYTMREIGAFFGVHYATVSRALRRIDESNARCKT